jgi:hypothetical protein
MKVPGTDSKDVGYIPPYLPCHLLVDLSLWVVRCSKYVATHRQHATTFQNEDERTLSRRQEAIDGKRRPLRFIRTTLRMHLAQRS